jgi:hypothetical protein
MYDDAVKFISTFLSSPESRASTSPLRLLQAFIIELGLCPASPAPALPASLRAAKALLKSHAFLNVRDYLAAREQGLPALQRIMYPSRSALSKHIRKTGNKVSTHWAKQHGLQVFLVHCFR